MEKWIARHRERKALREARETGATPAGGVNPGSTGLLFNAGRQRIEIASWQRREQLVRQPGQHCRARQVAQIEITCTHVCSHGTCRPQRFEHTNRVFGQDRQRAIQRDQIGRTIVLWPMPMNFTDKPKPCSPGNPGW